MSRSRTAFGLGGAALAVSGVGGCADFVGVEHVGTERSARQLAISALTGDVPSAATGLVLRRFALAEQFEDEPRAALARLHEIAFDVRDRDMAFAVAEASFLVARDEEDPALYLTAACWAWFALFDPTLGPAIGAFDRRFRLCCDLYNEAVTEALRGEGDEDESLQLVAGERSLLDGKLRLAVDLRAVRFDRARLPRLLPAADYEIHGLANRYRIAGIGAAAIAARDEAEAGAESMTDYLTKSRCAAATCLLRIEGGVEELKNGVLEGTIELHQPIVTRTVKVGDATVPLEIDATAVVAYFVQDSGLFDFELSGLFGGEIEDFTGLYPVQPHSKGKIPVVLVHGTSSSLARWAGLINDLSIDPLISQRMEIWLFTYQTGQPVPVSADRLRVALVEAREKLDPGHEDPALDSMVVIGHSQGGLLTRQLVAVDPEHRLWDSMISKPLEELELSDESRSLAQRVFFSQPLSFVQRTIYVATPHRGSFQADRWYSRIGMALITVPKQVVGFTVDLTTNNLDAMRSNLRGRTPSSLAGMQTDNPYLLALADLPVAPGVHQHCVAAIDGDDEPPEGDDGVVAYESAALPADESLFLVRDTHSCQANPLVVNEVRRILRAHLLEFDAAHPQAPR